MKKLFAVLPVLMVTLVMFTLSPQAEAKRLGSGSSMGKQYNTPSKSTTQSTTSNSTSQQTTAAAPGGARPSGASRWLGPLAGLAAGGLLAAMLFGDAFEGLQIMDFLLIAALVFGGIMLFRAMRAKGNSPQLRTAGGPAMGGDFRPAGNVGGAGENSVQAKSSSVQENLFDAPAWFDPLGFTKGAKVHFIRMQAAWDKGDMKDIAEYTTPELFAEIQADRLSSGSESNFTEVVSLDAEVLKVHRDGDKVVASVHFSGLIREERDGAPHDFAEIWHVIHDWNNAEGDWFVAGIQQV